LRFLLMTTDSGRAISTMAASRTKARARPERYG
jgi:hypothetical protein